MWEASRKESGVTLFLLCLILSSSSLDWLWPLLLPALTPVSFPQAQDAASLCQQWNHYLGHVLQYVEAFQQHRATYQHIAIEKQQLIAEIQNQFLDRLKLEKY